MRIAGSGADVDMAILKGRILRDPGTNQDHWQPTELTKPLFSVLSVLHTGHFLHQSQHWRSIPPESDFASNIEDFLRPTIAILRFINLCCPLS